MSLIFTKCMKDVLFGQLEFTDLEMKFIDTPHFQALRDIKQLGVAHLVYPNANHTRFEHSLEVVHIVTMWMMALKRNQPKLDITDRWIQRVRLSVLHHDIGHLPIGNHAVDEMCDEGLMNLPTNLRHHEDRSCALFRYLSMSIEELDDEDRDVICGMIKGEPPPATNPHDLFYYQFVANHVGGIDADRLGWLCIDSFFTGKCNGLLNDLPRIFSNAAVVDHNLVFHEKIAMTLWINVFEKRMIMHHDIYHLESVETLTMMHLELVRLMNEFMNWSTLFDEQHTWRLVLTDHILHQIVMWYFQPPRILQTHEQDIIERAYLLYQRIKCRELYSHHPTTNAEGKMRNRRIKLSYTGSEITCHPLDLKICYRMNSNDIKEMITLRESARMTKLVPSCFYEEKTFSIKS